MDDLAGQNRDVMQKAGAHEMALKKERKMEEEERLLIEALEQCDAPQKKAQAKKDKDAVPLIASIERIDMKAWISNKRVDIMNQLSTNQKQAEVANMEIDGLMVNLGPGEGTDLKSDFYDAKKTVAESIPIAQQAGEDFLSVAEEYAMNHPDADGTALKAQIALLGTHINEK
tara:strand:- start:1332 stop:1847 length:516 start_codon:yes stop_codon:yes gene_type:complete